MILIAEPRMLGLLREAERGVLKHDVKIKELAKDYTQLAVTELHEHLVESGIMIRPAVRPAQS